MRILGLVLSVCLAGCGGPLPATTAMLAADHGQFPDLSTERKVIDTVHLDLRVETVSTVASQLPTAVNAVKGYIAESHLTQSQHSGSWTIRIPASQVAMFVEQAKQWGVVHFQRTTAEDVTDQFIDVTARLSAKRIEEERLLKLLQESTGTLADILAVEKELQRVRQEIEQTQGRVQYLEHATQFATIHLRVHELFGVSWSDGQPLGTQIVNVGRSSLSLLVLFARGLVLIIAAATPWLVVAVIPAILTRRWIRQRRTIRQQS